MPHDLNRRQFIQTGVAAGAAAAMSSSVQAESARRPTLVSKPADALVFVWLGGGLSQTETFDPKPHTPLRRGMKASDLRGPCASIPTAIPGVEFAEGLEKTAELMRLGTVVRSVTHTHPLAIDHDHATSLWLTGQPAHAGAPMLGHTIAEARGPIGDAPYTQVYCGRGPISDDITINALQREVEDQSTTPRLERIPYHDKLTTRQKPGMSRNVNLGLDFVEAANHATYQIEDDARFVFVEFAHEPYQALDTHQDGASKMNVARFNLDMGLWQLIESLETSGRLDTTAVVVASEFGRTIRCDPAVGQDYTIDDRNDFGLHAHFPGCQSVLLFGGPFKRGHVFGRSADAHPMLPVESPVSVEDMRATILAAVGVTPTVGRVIGELLI